MWSNRPPNQEFSEKQPVELHITENLTVRPATQGRSELDAKWQA